VTQLQGTRLPPRQIAESVQAARSVPELRKGGMRILSRVLRGFGDLRVRPKLIVLHNLFFLGLGGSLYLAVPGRAPLVVLGAGYVAAVLLLELLVLPVYVYRPLRVLLEADEAARRGDREHELIDESLITRDELGQLMRARNEATIALRKAAEMLADQDRLASLGLMSASVAHELNTPLAVLEGSAEKLMETARDPASQERLRRMMRVIERLRAISGDLLDFARARPEKMEPVAVRDLIEQAWNLVSIDEKAAGVDFQIAGSAGDRVMGNPGRLTQVFVNVLRNALGAIGPGGSVRVECRRRADAVEVAVDDDGPGIPPEILPQVFEAFVTTRLDAEGTGLGLTVAEGIVRQHGGSIEAANRHGGGARILVRLPAAEGNA
jgi:C4-dicarboxylate-specific signal transduction histidine kinase